MSIKFYEYNRCGTCRKAQKFLDENNISYQKVAIREEAPSIDELKIMLESMGSIRKLFNSSGVDYRSGGYKDKLPNMSEDEALKELSANGNLVKRPFMIGKGVATVGFKEELWREIFS